MNQTTSTSLWKYHLNNHEHEEMAGFKLHVSISFLEYELAMRSVDHLINLGLSFKYAASPEILRDLNAGLMGYTQVGKFLTVYPMNQTPIYLNELAQDLHNWSVEFTGPVIPSDRRFKGGNVYYRYWDPGSDKGDVASRLVPVPDGVFDPFKNETVCDDTTHLPDTLIILKPIRQSAKGGVYDALDLAEFPPRLVIVKEGRRGVDLNIRGEDAMDRIKAESHALQILEQLGLTPRVCGVYDFKDSRFIKVEKLNGSSLRNLLGGGWVPKPSTIRYISGLLSAAVSTIHRAGFFIGDVSPDNILICENGELKLIDMEYARPIDSHPKEYLEPTGTPGFIDTSLYGTDADLFACSRVNKALSDPAWYRNLITVRAQPRRTNDD